MTNLLKAQAADSVNDSNLCCLDIHAQMRTLTHTTFLNTFRLFLLLTDLTFYNANMIDFVASLVSASCSKYPLGDAGHTHVQLNLLGL